MAIKDVLVYLDNDTNCANRITSTAKLCSKLGAHLAGLYSYRMLKVHPYPYTYLPNSAFNTMEENARQQQEETRALFASNTAAEDISAEFRTVNDQFRTVSDQFRTVNDQLSNALSIQSRYADLLVVPGRYGKNSNHNHDFQLAEILPISACPVLVLPEDQPAPTQLPKRVLVAWNGSHESARALSLAMPILEQAEQVDLVSVSSDEAEASDIAKHLTHHGIKVNVHLVEGSSFNAGKTLLNQAITLESELVVMGAYGHSRFREQVLGGATEYMIGHASLPVLFSH
jgi:nucleotide-binding universal stress UspA family protein